MVITMSLGMKLKTLRLTHGYSQKDVAQMLHVTPQTISKWENYWSYPTKYHLLFLCDLYDITMDELIKTTNFSRSSCLESPKNINEHFILLEFYLLILLTFLFISPIVCIFIPIYLLLNLKRYHRPIIFIICTMFLLYNLLCICITLHFWN